MKTNINLYNIRWKKRVVTCLPLFFIFNSFTFFARGQDSICAPKGIKKVFHVTLRETKKLGNDFERQVSSPIRIKPLQVPILAGTAAGLIYLIQKDEHIYSNMQPLLTHPDVYDGARIASQVGDLPGISAVLLFGVVSAATKYEKGNTVFWDCARAMIGTAVWTRIIKVSTGKERPYFYYQQGVPHKKWTGFNLFDSHYHSFSSGHTGNAFAIATVFAQHYKKTVWVPILAYSLAASTGVARMVLQKHWSSDVFAGASVGFFCGYQVTLGARKRK